MQISNFKIYHPKKLKNRNFFNFFFSKIFQILKSIILPNNIQFYNFLKYIMCYFLKIYYAPLCQVYGFFIYVLNFYID